MSSNVRSVPDLNNRNNEQTDTMEIWLVDSISGSQANVENGRERLSVLLLLRRWN